MIKKEQSNLKSNVLICLSLSHLHLSVPMYFQGPKLSSSRNLPLSARFSLWEPCSPSISLPLVLPLPPPQTRTTLFCAPFIPGRVVKVPKDLSLSPGLSQSSRDKMLHILSSHCLYSCGRPRALYPEIQECPSRAGNF